jgi:hypothetical protein
MPRRLRAFGVGEGCCPARYGRSLKIEDRDEERQERGDGSRTQRPATRNQGESSCRPKSKPKQGGGRGLKKKNRKKRKENCLIYLLVPVRASSALLVPSCSTTWVVLFWQLMSRVLASSVRWSTYSILFWPRILMSHPLGHDLSALFSYPGG